MDTRNFIESGILESYLLGMATDEEKDYVKQKLLTDQEIADKLVDVEDSITAYFNSGSVPPPPALREVVSLRTTKSDLVKPKHVFNRAPKEDTPKKDEYLDIEVNDTYIKVHKYWRPAFIAVFILSKVFLIAGLYYYFKTTSLEQELTRIKTEINLPK